LSSAALRDLADLHAKLRGREWIELDREVRELLSRRAAAVAAVTEETPAETEMTEGEEGIFDVEREAPATGQDAAGDEEPYLSRPGAYRMQAGREPHRAASAGSSDSASMPAEDPHGDAPAASAARGRAPSAADRTLLVEANLVREEEVPATLLVEAKPIRRKRQIAIIALVALAVLAIIVGLSAGLTANRPVLPSTPSPTPAPTSQLDQQFRPTLPPYTLDSLINASSPQSLAYEWVTEVDQRAWSDAPNDEELRPERMNQRFFALATIYYAIGGDTL
jgi:hypothetical protein